MIPIYILAIICLVGTAFYGSHSVDVYNQSVSENMRTTIVIDAGHGGIDGGATSCTGVLESMINLDIALRINDLFCLLGYDTVMIRKTDESIYTEGSTIAAQKLSDLKERVRITSETENAVLISIHQNTFSDSRYHGAQVFYAPTLESDQLAKRLQQNLIACLDPDSNRQIKKADNVYFLQHISCPGVLIECGFLSNPEEEAKLRSEDYQKKLAAVIVSACSLFLAE